VEVGRKEFLRSATLSSQFMLGLHPKVIDGLSVNFAVVWTDKVFLVVNNGM